LNGVTSVYSISGFAIVAKLVTIPGSPEISMTTNGTLLRKLAAILKRDGLARVNISLDSLDPSRFAGVTRGGDVRAAIDGIRAALEYDLRPVRLNTVANPERNSVRTQPRHGDAGGPVEIEQSLLHCSETACTRRSTYAIARRALMLM